MPTTGYRKRTIILLIGLLLVRFWFGQTFELSGEEAYLWLQGHGTNLSPAYWERGPFVPWLIRLGTMFFGDTELGVRWPAAVMACMSGFILFYLARHWFNARAAFWTVVLFIIIPIYAWKFSFMTEASASIGLMAVTLFAFCRAVEDNRVWWWLLGGASCGFALLVALTNAWWIVGLICYFLLKHDRWTRLRDPRLWGTIFFISLFLLPISWWWRGSQVADVTHAQHVSQPSHAFSINHGFHFLWTEIWNLSPCFFIFFVAVLWSLGRQLWEDPRYSLLACLSLPGLLWVNLAAFFQADYVEFAPALFLPLVLLAGCHIAQMTELNRQTRLIAVVVFSLAALQTLSGLNPFYIAPRLNGPGHQIYRTKSGENATSFYASKRQISWRNLADAIQNLQRDQGATLIITDSPETASALCFYLPRNPFVYVESNPGVITHFDFWPHYDESASPNDSALYLAHSTDPPNPADPPPNDIMKDFASVTQMEDPPLPGFDKSWDIWICQKFIGGEQPANPAPATSVPDSEALPK